jgi:membrane protein DedA with SNARE-associated domain
VLNLFAELILYLESILLAYGPLGVFLGSIIEEIIAPIPSTLIIMGTSFIMLKGVAISPDSLINLFINIVLPASLGVTIGSLFVYAITYYLGKPFLERWGKYLGVSWGDIEKAEDKFEKSRSDEILLFIVRAVPILPSVAISAFCGFVRFDLKKYVIITFFGTLVRAFILGFIGWQFGSIYQAAADEISYLEEIGLAVVVIAIVGYIIYKKKFKRNKDVKRS